MAKIGYKAVLGLEVKRGKPSLGKRPAKDELYRLYVKKGKSIREIAEISGCSKDMISRALKEYGIERRPGSKGKTSKLNKFKISELMLMANNKGITRAAKDLKVDIRTLKSFIERSNR